ncbi:hypothetical protein Ocin01_05343, partial [Orchesella cincta]
FAAPYRTDIGEKQEAMYCEHRKHLTFKPTATCCNNQVIKPGLDFEKGWKSCAKKTEGNDLVTASWSLYACILKKSGANDEISLQEFADLITANYPEEIKMKAALDNIAKLEKIRVTYYDIETEVCTGMSSESKSYGNIEACSTWKEENHRAGMCCKRSFPVDIRYKSLLDLNNDDGSKTYCKTELTQLSSKNVTETMEQNLLEICDVVCAMKKMKKLNDLNEIVHKHEYWNFDINNIFKQGLLPDFVPSDLVQQAIQYANETFSFNSTIEAMKNYTFADVIPGDSNTFRSVHFSTYVKLGNKTVGDKFELEFMQRNWHKNIIHVPIICSAYREILTLMEHHLFQNCAPEEVTEAPPEPEAAPEPVATQAPEPEPESTDTTPSDAGPTEAPAAE